MASDHFKRYIILTFSLMLNSCAGIIESLQFDADAYREQGDMILSVIAITVASALTFLGDSFLILIAMAALLLPKIGRYVFTGAVIVILFIYAIRFGISGMAVKIAVEPFLEIGKGIGLLIRNISDQTPEYLVPKATIYGISSVASGLAGLAFIALILKTIFGFLRPIKSSAKAGKTKNGTSAKETMDAS